MHGLRQQTEEMIEHLMPQLDAGLFGEPGRTLDVGEQHRDALALADHGAGGTRGTVAQLPRRIADDRGIGRKQSRPGGAALVAETRGIRIRSEARRGGKQGVHTLRSRWSPDNEKKKK